MTSTRGIYMLAPQHAAQLPELGGALAALGADPPDDAAAFVVARTKEREAGLGRSFTIEDEGRLVGLCELRGLDAARARLAVFVAERHRRRGHGAFAVGMVLRFAFTNLRLPAVDAFVRDPDDVAARRTLEANGFTTSDGGLRYEIERDAWHERLHRPALSRLVPALRTILDTELGLGNEIAESDLDWPDPGSALVRLRHPFRGEHAPLPPGIAHATSNDPHWWKVEYATSAPPRQLLVH